MAARSIAASSAVLVVCVGLTLGARASHAQPPGPQAADAQAVEALAKKSGCFDCHRAAEKGIGPSFRDIAARYAQDGRARKTLTAAVKKGSKGNWTAMTRGVPMPPYSARLSDAEIQRLVDWTLAR